MEQQAEVSGLAAHPQYRIAMRISVGEVCRYARRLEEAESHHRHALSALEAMRTRADLSERALGECVDYEHDALSHLGNCLVSLSPERYDEAEACLRRALKMSEGARAVEARGQLVLDDEKERDYTCLARCLGKSSTDVAKQQEAESLARRVWSKRAQA